ncbi:MAG: hypothetical protein AB9833_03950 [Bacteroidales bacterium]
MISSKIDENIEENRDKKLAKVLGISFDDLSQTDFDIDTDKSDDGLVYNLLIKFRDSSPVIILKKINGIDENRTVYLKPNALD